MAGPDRKFLEQAANAYFATLGNEIDQPRSFLADHYDEEIKFQVSQSEAELRRCDTAIVCNQYDAKARASARYMLDQLNGGFDTLDVEAQRIAMNYAVRAERQQMRYLLHSLREPTLKFTPDDHLFQADPIVAQPVVEAKSSFTPGAAHSAITLERGVEMYIDYQVNKGWQGSMREESLRVLRWMLEEIDPGTPVSAITVDQMRTFRNCMMALALGGQGKKLPLKQRLMSPGREPLRFASKEKYWRSTCKFFMWFQSEYSFPDPTDSLLFEGGRNELRKSPKPFSDLEQRRFVQTPLFAGFQSIHRLGHPGDCHVRGGHWWSALLMMYTGMRACDIAQLLPGDFYFDDAIPYLAIQPGKLPEGMLKRSKFGPRTHLIPLHPVLLELGLKQFVELRAKQKLARRVLFEIGLGGNRMSAGMTRFWGRYLRKFGLFKDGRSTHVHRHTVAARLRAANVIDEDIGAILGHSPKTVTGSYGGYQALPRQLATLQKLDYGFDVVAALGGGYDRKRHG